MTGDDPEYQYHLKDHLGNVRITFTTKEEVEAPTATLETTNENEERSNFLKYDDIRKVNSRLFDHTDTGSTQYAMRLSGTPSETYGLARSMAVMPGDVITAEVFAKYVDLSNPDLEAFLQDFVADIVAGTTSPGVVIDGGSFGSPEALTIPFGTILNKSSEAQGVPKAYLNWIVFDKNFRAIDSKSGYRRVTIAAKEDGSLDPANGLEAEGFPHEPLSTPTIEITEPGYVYIYLSNEEEGTEVYFDDFTVTHTKSPVIASNDYMPFGLAFNSYSRESSIPNKYKYNGMEEQDELSLNWLDYGARMYDPTIARWMVVDPMSDKARRMSPYSYVYNNPLIFVDPDGMFGEYYAKDGNYLGTDGIDDKKVYTADKATATTTKAEDGTETTTTTFENAEQIGVESDFVDMNGKTISSDETKKDLVGLAIYLRNEEGVEGAKVTVQGGDRDATKNKKVGGSPTSPHMAGHAADISVSGMTNEALAIAAGNSGLFTGVIYYPTAGDTQGFGTHVEQKEAYVWFDKITYNQTTPNYQNLPAHVHVDNRSGTGVSRKRYAGDTSKDKTKQTGTYVPWVSNSQIK